MNVTVVLDNIGEVTVSDVHPIALTDAVQNAVSGALRLQRELAASDGES